MSKSSKAAHVAESPINHKLVTIGGEQFTVALPYVAGHVINEGEANALNQTLVENCRNNLSGKAKDSKLTQADVDAYLANYQFGAKGGFTANPSDRIYQSQLLEPEVLHRSSQETDSALEFRLHQKHDKPNQPPHST